MKIIHKLVPGELFFSQFFFTNTGEKQLENSLETVGIQVVLNYSTGFIQPGGLEKLNNGR